MIQTYLAEEIKKVKATVEQQLKATEDSVNRKLEDDNQARSGRRDSLKKKKWISAVWVGISFLRFFDMLVHLMDIWIWENGIAACRQKAKESKDEGENLW